MHLQLSPPSQLPQSYVFFNIPHITIVAKSQVVVLYSLLPSFLTSNTPGDPESTVLYGVTSADVGFVCFSHVQRSADCQGFRMALELLHMSVTYLQKANLSIFHDNK